MFSLTLEAAGLVKGAFVDYKNSSSDTDRRINFCLLCRLAIVLKDVKLAEEIYRLVPLDSWYERIADRLSASFL